jgi:uncharacterized coiled-coil DUF342 family protein
MRPAMQRAIDAIERIERALARIERAEDQDAAGAASAAELARLRTAHDQLRARVRDAISEIDVLLAARDGAGA